MSDVSTLKISDSDPITILQNLIRCPSVTPLDAGALDYMQAWLTARGFTCHRLPYGQGTSTPSDNLFARLGTASPHFCFAGHTDVVPPGNPEDWKHPPFSAELDAGKIWGRGAVDMKGGVAAFMAATDALLAKGEPIGSISFLITGDEEGPAVHGTKAVVEWMQENDQVPDACLVGEPTNPSQLTDMIKIGRRGSFTADVEFEGVQGHAAYPHLANNPVHAAIAYAGRLTNRVFDKGTEHFPASNLEVVTFDVGNPTGNVIPARARLKANIRFNDLHTAETLTNWFDGQKADVEAASGVKIFASYDCSGNSFVFEPKAFGELLADVVEAKMGKRPEYSTTGGTSDARFIKNICPVAEYGLVGQTMHKVDESVDIEDLIALTDIYVAIVERFFEAV